MYYLLKLDNVEDLGNNRVLVTVEGNTIVVSESAVTTPDAEDMGVSSDIAQALVDIRLLTRFIEDRQDGSQPSNLSPQVPPSTDKPMDNPRESEPSIATEPSDAMLESLGLRKKEVTAPFQVNEEVPKKDIVGIATKLNKLYRDYPGKRRQVIERISGMVRSDMLRVKECLDSDLRRAVLGSILNRDSLKTAVVPPDLAAFVDDRPLSETLGTRQWDPGSEQARDNISSTWSESQVVTNKIAEEVDDSEFAHMYPSTSDVAVQVNRKFSSANEPKR